MNTLQSVTSPPAQTLPERAVHRLLLTHEQSLLSALTEQQQEQLSDLLRALLRYLTHRFGVADRP